MIKVETILKKSSSGFTMIEIIIVITTMAVFGALTAEILSNATKVYSSSLERQQFISEARSSFFKIAREISWQKSFSGFTESTNKKVVINTGDENVISYEIQSSNDILHSNDQINTELLTNKINYNNSEYSYLNSENNVLDIQTQSHEIMLVNLKINFTDGDHSIVFNSDVIPYGLSFGKSMSYHE